MGLPPLFEPHSELDTPSGVNGVASINVLAATPPPTSTDVNMAAQVFVPVRLKEYDAEVICQTIVVQEGYSKYSSEV